MKTKKLIKIILGVIIFFTLPSILLFGFVYFKYNEAMPTGAEGAKADALATKMLDALNYEAYKNTDYLEWTFKNRRHYKWKKNNGICTVFWRNNKVELDFINPEKSVVYIDNIVISSSESKNLIEQANNYFNLDSFWLIGPYQVFEKGTKRRLISQTNKTPNLLVTHTSGDSYLWILDKNGKPTHCKIWADYLPFGGLEATWTDWTTMKNGATLPTFHKLLLMGLEIKDLKTKQPKITNN